MRFAVAVLLVALVSSVAINTNTNNTTVEETKSVKDVMKALHKGGLHKKIMGGKATDEDKKKLVDLYIHLVENDAPKGDETEWKMTAGMAMMSAAKVAVGREDGLEAYKAASNCKACHDKFK